VGARQFDRACRAGEPIGGEWGATLRRPARHCFRVFQEPVESVSMVLLPMEHIDVLRFVLALLTSLMTCYFLVGLFAGAQRRQQQFERRLKGGGGMIMPMSPVRRVAAALMCGLLAAHLFAGAFHSNLSAVTGINAAALFYVTFYLLPPLVLLLGVWDRRRLRCKHDPAVEQRGSKLP
jgi:hypothetical protein